MGLVQGLTEFLPVSSSGHLVLLPYLFGWDDAFITSLAFSVMLHFGTLVALLAYFRADWLRLVPAGLAVLRDRSFRGDPDRRLAWLLAASTIPAALAGMLFNDVIEASLRGVGLVVVMLVVGAFILAVADRVGKRTRTIEGVTFPIALAIGAAQALALIPGLSRSGISLSAGRLAGLDREAAARFSFLMATPITLGAGLYETYQVITLDGGPVADPGPLVAGLIASLVAGLLAIHFMLRYLRTRSLDVFVVYRLILAAAVTAVLVVRTG
ncbi:MAG: undecaprenyl-diphosphate phosphatase [Candidatus Limnocylindria bacterium]